MIDADTAKSSVKDNPRERSRSPSIKNTNDDITTCEEMTDTETAKSCVHETFTIEKIIRKKIVAGETHYKVKWLGYPSSENTWEISSDLVDVFRFVPALEEFEKSVQGFVSIGNVKTIVEHTIMDGITDCFIRWQGHCNGYNTWELAENILAQDSKRIVVAEEYETQVMGSKVTEHCIENIEDRDIINGKIYCLVKWKGIPESGSNWILLTVLLDNGLIRLKPLEHFNKKCQ